MKYRFNEFVLDDQALELRQNGSIVKIEPLVFDLLLLLVSNSDRVVTKDEIHDRIWQGRIVSEASLNRCVSEARFAIGDSGKQQNLIKTIHGRGFRFVGALESLKDKNVLPTRQILSEMTTARKLRAVLMLLVIIVGAGVLAQWIPSLRASDVLIPELPSKTVKANPDANNAVSIAVLPFLDMSKDQDHGYLADGISEEILNVLANIDGLKVASRTSSFVFRDNQVGMMAIAEALDVDYVLEGSVRASGENVRITAQLINAKTNNHVWSKTYSGFLDVETLFELQDEIAKNVSKEINGQLPAFQPPQNRGTISVAAYEAYLRGNALRHKNTKKLVEAALEQYDTALQLDPDFAAAYAGRVEAYRILQKFNDQPVTAVTSLMASDIEHASSLAPNAAEVLSAAASLALFELRYDDVLQITKKSIDSHPNYAPTFRQRGEAMFELGRHAEAESSYKASLVLDPLSPYTLNLLAEVQQVMGNLDGAVKTAEANYKWNPSNSSALDMIAFLKSEEADYAQSHKILKQAERLNPDDPRIKYALIYIYTDVGLYELARNTPVTHRAKAFAHGYLGERDAALEALKLSPNGLDYEEVLYMIGEIELAHKYLNQQVDAENMMGSAPVPHGEGDLFTEACTIYREMENSRADVICQKTAAFFNDKNPSDLSRVSDIKGGVAWHTINGNMDTAFLWMDYLVDTGHSCLKFTTNPSFAPMESHPRYEDLMRRMNVNAKRHRDAILKQL